MLNVKAVAAYIVDRYKTEYGTDIDQMKLHKLLYFAQREALVQTGSPLFADRFEARKYGPVMPCVRYAFDGHNYGESLGKEEIEEYAPVFDVVFEKYASISSWDLSMLSHSETSWRKARNRKNGDNTHEELMRTEDIALDANHVRERRELYSRFH